MWLSLQSTAKKRIGSYNTLVVLNCNTRNSIDAPVSLKLRYSLFQPNLVQEELIELIIIFHFLTSNNLLHLHSYHTFIHM